MPNFKPKTTKKIQVDFRSSITLDGKHNDILNEIHKEENEEYPILLNKVNYLKELLKSQNYNSIDEKLEISDKIKEIKLKLKNIKNKKKEYLLENAKDVFKYFENKKNIGKSDNKSKKLNSFFKIDSSNNSETDDTTKNIVNSYLSRMNSELIDVNNFVVQTSICEKCNKGELVPMEEEGILICNKCATNKPYLIENEKPSYKEPPKEVCFYAYKRINHFREILAQFQAKETTQIPETVIEDIKNQIKKERITTSCISNAKAKEILKKLGYNKYYEHIPFIKDIIGIKPPVMTPELEDTLCNLFMDIQSPYAKYCPDDRVNFLNYYYTVYKLCELLGQDQFLPFFPMLKDREKRIEQDNIWKKICNELDWAFIPTI
tara:strand:- start:2848 stop:3975 length:1128 start_codon:yes stop_codon:yes gene_type:complete